MGEHFPDKWVILKIEGREKIFYKVFGTWAGGYLTVDSWRLNSGIVRVEEDEDHIRFIGRSGSVYACTESMYGIAGGSNYGVLNEFLGYGQSAIEVMPQETNWMELV